MLIETNGLDMIDFDYTNVIFLFLLTTHLYATVTSLGHSTQFISNLVSVTLFLFVRTTVV